MVKNRTNAAVYVIGGGMLCGALLLGASAALGQGEPEALPKAEALSSQESVTQGRAYVAKMKSTQGNIQKLVDRARQKKDIIRLNCVEDKQMRVNGHLTVAQQSMRALEEASSRSDDGSRQHEFTRVSILYQKVLVLGTEAENCIGEDVSYVGQTQVEMEIDPSIPQEDPTQPPPSLPDIARPPEASPFV